MPKRVLVLDTETTGFSPENHRIVEFAAAEVQPRTGVICSELHHLINPGRPIPLKAVEIHGITNEKVENQPTFGEIADKIEAFLRDATIAAHSAPFDVRMLEAEFDRVGKPRLADLGVTIVDTVDVARSIYPLLPGHNLDDLCSHLDISLKDRLLHGAAIDVHLLARALPRMATDYDAWMATVEDACGTEIEDFERSMNSFCDHVLASIDRSTAERVDDSFCRINTALRLIKRQYDDCYERCSSLIGMDNWYCKFFFARHDTVEHTSWKTAQEALIPGVDLAPYRASTPVQRVDTDTDQIIQSMLDRTYRLLDSEGITTSPHSIASALITLRKAKKKLTDERKTLRDDLLAFYYNGYEPIKCKVTSSNQSTIDYEKACREHAPDADFTPYRSSSSRLEVGERQVGPCEALFGAT